MSMKMRMDGLIMVNTTHLVILGPCIVKSFKGTLLVTWKVFFMGVPNNVVCKMHIERHVYIYVEQHGRYFFLTRKDVANIYTCMTKRNYQLHKKDETSVNIWFQKKIYGFFLFQNPNGPNVHL